MSFVYSKGSHEGFSESLCISVPLLKVVFNSAKSEDPDEMQHHAAFHLDLQHLPMYPLRGFKYTEGSSFGIIDCISNMLKASMRAKTIMWLSNSRSYRATISKGPCQLHRLALLQLCFLWLVLGRK